MNKKIKIIKGGPYVVSGDVPLKIAKIKIDGFGTSESWEIGRTYKTEESYRLCRCGHSANRPFCDGTHAKIGFVGEEVASNIPYDESAEFMEGGTLDALDDENLCSYFRFCDRGRRFWQAIIDSEDEEARQLAIEEAGNCAAGRLTALRKNGEKIEPSFDEEIHVTQDTALGRRGPLAVKSGIEIEGSDGRIYEKRNRVALCRCGESRNMPFCDASHVNARNTKGFDK